MRSTDLGTKRKLDFDNPEDVEWLCTWAELAQQELDELREKVKPDAKILQKIMERLSEEQREKKLMSENLILLDLGKAERLRGYLAGIERAIHIIIGITESK